MDRLGEIETYVKEMSPEPWQLNGHIERLRTNAIWLVERCRELEKAAKVFITEATSAAYCEHCGAEFSEAHMKNNCALARFQSAISKLEMKP